jgi:hypothetical protein
MLASQNLYFFRPALLLAYLLTDDSASRIARELWWTSYFSPADIIITMVLHAHISPGG